ncbi:hypothetical protein FSP39_017337 [Pinctada imbricata]|uniref:SH2 domain-containing protein n=1 Tax=Pinctada imbricata TaxID=66713 RepID=A0AA89C514_PINIB|nr:hypothetical protein FSP39_017337 [Pinctada imbricata]
MVKLVVTSVPLPAPKLTEPRYSRNPRDGKHNMMCPKDAILMVELPPEKPSSQDSKEGFKYTVDLSPHEQSKFKELSPHDDDTTHGKMKKEYYYDMSIFKRWFERKQRSKTAKHQGLESLMGLDRSHIEDETLRHSSWYQAGIPREIALEILQQEEIGSFIVRDSSTHPGCYALSVRVPKFENPTGISHYLILKTQRGVKLKGLDKEWPDLLALVTHHTVMSEMLPCTLKLPRKSKNPTYKESEDDRKEEDPDYQRLSDFSSMMAALKN